MEDSIFHPNSASIPQTLITAVTRKWSIPRIDFLPECEDYGNGFLIVDPFTGTWKVTIEKQA